VRQTPLGCLLCAVSWVLFGKARVSSVPGGLLLHSLALDVWVVLATRFSSAVARPTAGVVCRTRGGCCCTVVACHAAALQSPASCVCAGTRGLVGLTAALGMTWELLWVLRPLTRRG
jgi:hypothetical protein